MDYSYLGMGLLQEEFLKSVSFNRSISWVVSPGRALSAEQGPGELRSFVLAHQPRAIRQTRGWQWERRVPAKGSVLALAAGSSPSWLRRAPKQETV